jgi:hypothetical protein
MGTVLDIFYGTIACDISKFMEKKEKKKDLATKINRKIIGHFGLGSIGSQAYGNRFFFEVF